MDRRTAGTFSGRFFNSGNCPGALEGLFWLETRGKWGAESEKPVGFLVRNVFWSQMCFFFSHFLVINSLKMGFLTPIEPQLWPPRDHECLGRADASSGWCFPLQNPSPARISGNHNPLSSSELKSGEFVVVWAWGLFSRAEPTGLGCSVTGGSASRWAAEVQPRGSGSIN